MMFLRLSACLALCCMWEATALDNGLALTPPMGWLTWERFRCITDCKNRPNECISENLIRRTADLIVSEGYLEAGYNYVAIDDCWLEHKRGKDGRLVPDRERFPNGMKSVADYIHSKGLKFGLYEDYGNKTCAGYPGVLGYEKLDMETFAEWDVDYIKLDGCNVDFTQMDKGYPDIGKLLNETGRPILYSCSWPAYQESHILPDYKSIAEHCNMWRNWEDINDSYDSLLTIMDWFANNQERFQQFAGPGHWNDPDMLLIGNFGLSFEQSRMQMAVWSIMAAPLMMSTDLATIRPEFKEILLNKRVIAVNQDPLGIQGSRVFKGDSDTKKGLEVWTRELAKGAYAIAFVSRRNDGAGHIASFTFQEIQLPSNNYDVEDLFDNSPIRLLLSDDSFDVCVNPTGVKFYKFIPRGSEEELPEIRLIK